MDTQWYLLFPLTPKRLVLIVGKQSLMAFPSVAVLIEGCHTDRKLSGKRNTTLDEGRCHQGREHS